LKPTRIKLESFSPRVRVAAEFINGLPPCEEADVGLELASTLQQMQADEDTQMAGLLVSALQAGLVQPTAVREAFGEPALTLATELKRVQSAGIPADWSHGEHLAPEQAEGLRKLLLALASDVRLVLIRLALQLVRLRRLKAAPDARRKREALETREIYAPLASRLGIWQLKWELEDLAFRYSEPNEYKRIAGWLRVKRAERERFIDEIRTQLARELQRAGVTAEVTGRPKHIYSIWRKMQRKSLAFEQVMDVLAVRIIVATVGDCYAALGVVHSLWPYIPGEFDDYITSPKENNYRSLHTAVIGPAKLPLEVQIRTQEMHQHAELGVAAHWQYKENRKADSSFQQKIVWLRQLLEPGARDDEEADLLDDLRTEVFEDRVYALSPRGEVIELPSGGTPLDFAYHVHTSLGHRCRGALVNGKMVALDHKLHNGDTVEIIPAKHPRPSRDWVVPQLGYLASARNRSKVRSWFRKQDRGENLEQGRQMLERELDRLGVRAPPLPEILAELHLPSAEALHLGLGEGEITLAQVAGAVQRRLHEHEPPPAPKLRRPSTANKPDGIVIDGVGDLLNSIARCCRPVPPEAIAGYITLGRGVTIHRANCPNLLRMQGAQPRRVLAVDWGRTNRERTFPASLALMAFDRHGLVRDISAVLADEHVSIETMNTVTNAAENTAMMDITVTVRGLDELSRILSRLSSLPNVISVRRRH
jgi:GTP pyrophosphokinase